MFTTKKIARVSVINDLVTDNRVKKTCEVLVECGYHVVLIGRELKSSLPLPLWPYKAERMRLLFTKGPLFYFFFNLRLFFKLLFSKSDLLYANDLDTLLPNYLLSKWKGIPLIYDSHELFCEVPELQHSPLKKKVWQFLEDRLVPKVEFRITVNQSIARVLGERHGVAFSVVRNIPDTMIIPHKTRAALGLPEQEKLMILQGAGINVQRGAEELVEAMQWVTNARLLIIGGGDVWPVLKELVNQLDLKQKVLLMGKLPRAQLLEYTRVCDLGLTLDKNTNLNYYYSLPNKLFDYLFNGVPVLASRLPEIQSIVEHYEVGDFVDDHHPQHIAAKLNELLNSQDLKRYKENTGRVIAELNWESEKKVLSDVIQKAGLNAGKK